MTSAEESVAPVLPPGRPKSNDERIRDLDRMTWIGYGRAQEIREEVEAMIHRPQADRITSMAIVGESFNGKTFLLRNIQRRNNPPAAPSGQVAIEDLPQPATPVFFVQAPPEPDEARMYDSVLDALHMQGSPREPAQRKLGRIKVIFKGLGVRLLEIDEFGFFQAGSPNKQRKALNALKFMGNELGIPIVVATVESGLNVLTANDEIGNRYPAKFLPRWKVDDETRRLMRSMESVIELRRPSGLSEPDITEAIVANGNGILGHMLDLVRRLAKQAIKGGREQITKDDLTAKRLAALGWVHPNRRHERPV